MLGWPGRGVGLAGRTLEVSGTLVFGGSVITCSKTLPAEKWGVGLVLSILTFASSLLSSPQVFSL